MCHVAGLFWSSVTAPIVGSVAATLAIALANGTAARAQEVLSDIECKTIQTTDSVRTVCTDNTKTGSSRGSSAIEVEAAERAVKSARCQGVARGEKGWPKQDLAECPPTPEVCAKLAADRIPKVGCGHTGELWATTPFEIEANNYLPGVSVHPRLVLGCGADGQFAASLWAYSKLSPSSPVGRIKWDEQPPAVVPWVYGQDVTRGDHLTTQEGSAFVRTMAKHSLLAVEVTPRGGLPTALYFSINPTNPHFAAVRQRCH